MLDPKKIANNILDYLIDPTKIPVENRLYIGPEEKLQNQSYERAKADAFAAYGEQRFNSDFYPNRNRSLTQREASIMDRKSLIASFDILSHNFKDTDPIGKDLRVMAMAVSKMSDDELAGRLQVQETPVEAKAETFECPKCGTKVLKQTGYCVKCKAKVKPKSASEEEPVEAAEETQVEASEDFWSREADDEVATALLSDILGITAKKDEEDKEPVSSKKKEEEMKWAEDDDEAKKEEKSEKYSEDSEKEAKDKDPETEPGRQPQEEGDIEEEHPKEAKGDEEMPEEEENDKDASEATSEVNTDILASMTFGDIEIPLNNLVSSDDVGDLTEEERAKLSQLFK